MAETETRRIIEVGTGNSAKSLGELREAVLAAKAAQMQLDAAVNDGTATEEEYQQAVVKTKVAQEAYNKEMRIQVKENEAVKGSYNDLVNQLARLKEQWKQAEPGTDKYKELTNAVNQVKTKLEDADHDIGNWQRNVGNYGMQTKTMFDLTGNSIGKTGTQVVDMGKKFAAVAKSNPLLLAFTLLVGVIDQIVKQFRSSEENMQALQAAMVPLSAVGDLVTKTFQLLGKALAQAAKWLSDLALKWFPKLAEQAKLRNEETAKSIELTKRQREVTVENAQLELKAAEARNKAAQKDKYNATQRIAYLREAIAAEQQQLENNLEIAQKQYDIAKIQQQQKANDADANDALAQAEANLYRVRTEHYNGTIRLQSQLAAAIKESKGEVEELDQFVLATLGPDVDRTTQQMEENFERFIKKAQKAKDASTMLAEAEMEEIDAEVEALTQDWLKKMEETRKREGEINQERIDSAYAVAYAITDIGDMIAGALEDEINAKVKSGEISEKEGERQFENVKAIQYATTWINTLAGMTAALTSPVMQSLGCCSCAGRHVADFGYRADNKNQEYQTRLYVRRLGTCSERADIGPLSYADRTSNKGSDKRRR